MILAQLGLYFLSILMIFMIGSTNKPPNEWIRGIKSKITWINYRRYYKLLTDGEYRSLSIQTRSIQTKSDVRIEITFANIQNGYPNHVYIFSHENSSPYRTILNVTLHGSKFYHFRKRYWYRKFANWFKEYGMVDEVVYKRDRILNKLI